MLSDLLTLLATVDPFGTLAIFVGLTAHLTPPQRRRTAVEAIALSGAILLAFLVAGEVLLTFLGVSLLAFQLSGGIVFFLFGLKMIFGEATGEATAARVTRDEAPEAAEAARRSLAIYPLAIPSIASPGAILAVVLLTRNDLHDLPDQATIAALLVGVLAFTLGLLLLSERIFRIIGAGGANLLVRLLGLLLASIAGQMVLDAVVAVLRSVVAGG